MHLAGPLLPICTGARPGAFAPDSTLPRKALSNCYPPGSEAAAPLIEEISPLSTLPQPPSQRVCPCPSRTWCHACVCMC